MGSISAFNSTFKISAIKYVLLKLIFVVVERRGESKRRLEFSLE
jgi:hypothetical protein